MTVPPNPPGSNSFEPPAASAPPFPATGEPAVLGPQPIVIEDSAGAISRLLGWTLAWIGWILVLVASAVILFLWSGRNEYYETTGGISEVYVEGDKSARDKIAIIKVSGVIYEGEGYVRHQIERVRDDKDVKAVVVRVDSPGGTVTGSDYIYHHLKKLREEKRIPMVVSMGGIAASGGYYVSMAVGDQTDSIFAEPTTTTGSIGVIIPHYDISGLLENFHVKDDSIASHPRKQMLSMTRPIPDDQRTLLQSHVDELFRLFKERVRAGRPLFRKDAAALDQLATGEIFTAEKAKQVGLVDQIGFVEDAVTQAVRLAGLQEPYVRVVRYKQPPSLIDLPLFAQSPQGSTDLATLLELSTPRAYYLATSLPPLVSNRRTD